MKKRPSLNLTSAVMLLLVGYLGSFFNNPLLQIGFVFLMAAYTAHRFPLFEAVEDKDD